MADQHSPHVLGCAGDKIVSTPNIDRLAGEGVRFSHAYCGGPICVPSRMSFLTSRHCSDIKAVTNRGVLASDTPTFAHSLGASGYNTVLCGRMHLSRDNPQHGFEEKLVGDVSLQWSSKAEGCVFGNIPDRLDSQSRIAVEISGRGKTAYQAFDRAVADAAVEFLGSRYKNEKPFCLVVGFILPHNPLICPKELFDKYYKEMNVPRMSEEEKKHLHPAMRKWREAHGVDDIPDSQAKSALAAYYGLVEMLDGYVGEIMESLEKNGLRGKTAVFYTSDHGEMAGEHEMWWKSNFYEGSAGVPLVASFPGIFPEGMLYDLPVSLLDIAPTLIEIADAVPMPRISGTSLMPCIKREPGNKNDTPVFSEFFDESIKTPVRMVVRWPWKLIYYHDFAYPQLFNLKKDPGEIFDCGNSPAFSDIKNELVSLVKKDWDPEEINGFMEEEEENHKIISEWMRAVKPPDVECWKPPPHSNVFPE